MLQLRGTQVEGLFLESLDISCSITILQNPLRMGSEIDLFGAEHVIFWKNLYEVSSQENPSSYYLLLKAGLPSVPPFCYILLFTLIP
ncbi:MAG: hypothetical protein ACFE9C_14495 [Candidatus Hodarchaeota archaeon]